MWWRRWTARAWFSDTQEHFLLAQCGPHRLEVSVYKGRRWFGDYRPDSVLAAFCCHPWQASLELSCLSRVLWLLLFLLSLPSTIPRPLRDGYGWRVRGNFSLNSGATQTCHTVCRKLLHPETRQENLQGHLVPGLGNCAPPIREAKPDHLSLPLLPCAPLILHPRPPLSG